MTRKLLLLFLLSIIYLNCFANGNDELDRGAIAGSVMTSDKKPAENVTIKIVGTNKYTLTDENGKFSIHGLQPGNYILEASLIGYEPITKRVKIDVKVTTKIDIQMTISEKQLADVMVSSTLNKFAKNASDDVAKMPLKNLENPQVYSIVTHQLITDQMVYSLDDAIKNTPGIQTMWSATGRGGDGGAYYNSRGFVLQSQLRDGIAGNVTNKIDAADIESVEVLKGPSATLFGSTLTSYGGLINRITKKPYENFGGELSYAGGSYGFNRLSADVNAPLDSAKKLLIRVNTAYQYNGSFQDNGFNKSVIFAPTISYKANDRLDFLFNAELYNGEGTGSPFIFFYYPVAMLGADRADKLGVDYKRSYFSNDLVQTSRNSNFFGQMRYKISNNWTSQTNYSNTYSFSNGHFPYFFVVPNSVVTGNPNATGADYLSRGDQSTANSEETVSEIQQNFNGDFHIGDLRNRVVIGLDYFHQNSNQLFYSTDQFDIVKKNGSIPNYGNFNEINLDAYYQDTANKSAISHYPYKFKTNTYSAYASDVLNITDNLLALAAIRIDNFDNKGSFDETTGQYVGSYKQTAFSPKFGLVYQPVKEQIALFANYQNGFTNKTGVDYQGKTFKPEQANQIEGGIKLNTANGKLSGTFTYYNIKVTDIVRAYNDPSNPNAQIQNGTQVSKGIEAEVIANPLQGLNIDAGFSYNDSKYTHVDADVDGRRPSTAMSPYSANLWASYKFSNGSLKGFGLGFGGNYASDNKIVNSQSMGVFILPAYTVLNATAYYDCSKFRFGIKVDNLTNKEYWTGYTTMNPQQLRSVNASVAFKF
ncbi:TonB-dependent receptor [Arachidicoccus soli]|uniref:TonB-dependent siderophore receptor n=1 Tax=Arachidicoccus soli TaxID=2341117 RepID=A0A386HMK4_9BACT|nr:TonB-dependent receptor [Arachidicoccus soli]AYD46973.1 TonB-dependent siderophore receptor [Arachidicoccus soli]